MKILVNLICLTLIALVFFLGWTNINSLCDFSFFITDKTEKATTIVLFFGFVTGALCGVLYSFNFIQKGKDSIKAYERRLEKTSVSNDASSAKIKVLESKIQVLEKALADALKNK